MKKKKTHLKRLPLSFLCRRWQFVHLRILFIYGYALNRFAASSHLPTSINKPSKLKLLAAYLCIQTLTACAAIPTTHPAKIRYAAPPNTGSWLESQRELFACETIDAAKYMANTGFFHGQCTQLEHIGLQEYQVQSRTKIQLPEGPMWLLKVRRENTHYWVPIPWHDWA